MFSLIRNMIVLSVLFDIKWVSTFWMSFQLKYKSKMINFVSIRERINRQIETNKSTKRQKIYAEGIPSFGRSVGCSLCVMETQRCFHGSGWWSPVFVVWAVNASLVCFSSISCIKCVIILLFVVQCVHIVHLYMSRFQRQFRKYFLMVMGFFTFPLRRLQLENFLFHLQRNKQSMKNNVSVLLYTNTHLYTHTHTNI